MICAAVALLTYTARAVPLGTSFSYQGKLMDGGQPASGSYEFEFTLYDAETAGNSLGTLTLEEVPVSDGVFTVQLDYGAAAFDGNARWLEIWVRKDNDGLPGAMLTPRQAISAAPYTLMAKTVPNGAITGAKLADGAVTAGKIGTGAVEGSNIASGAVGSGHLAAGGVQAQHLAAGSVGASQLAGGAAQQNLLNGGLSPVAGGGIIMSQSATAPELVSAGYTQVGQAQLVNEAWAAKAAPQDFPSLDLAFRETTTVWTGTEMIVWGGRKASPNSAGNTGGRYNPTTDTWTPVTTTGAPSARYGHTAVWTGAEMIVWGGYDASQMRLNTGGRYNPATNTWTALTLTGAPSARSAHTAVWTGSLMIVYGGTGAGNTAETGARYNPSTNSWSAVASGGGRIAHGAVWTGTRMIVIGGDDGSGANYDLIYDPAANTWTSTATHSPLDAITGIAWTGTEVFFHVDGYSHLSKYNPATNTFASLYPPISAGFPGNPRLAWTGSRLVIWGEGSAGEVINLGTNTWTSFGDYFDGDSRLGESGVWTGSRMIFWGGQAPGSDTLNGGRFNPLTAAWESMAGLGGSAGRTGAAKVWTGSDLLVWGGVDDSTKEVQNGLRYNLAANTWTTISTVNAPAARTRHTAVWTGSEMLIWGGATADAEDEFFDGHRYQPGTGSWSPMQSVGAPGISSPHAVWTGTEMIVLGTGLPGPSLQGKRYNPATNAWTAMSMTNAPALRTNFALLWTGTEVILWGGGNLGVGNATGGRYNPATNSWSATSLVNAPPGRSHPEAVWTGSEMIIFGGGPDFGIYPTVNARYNPAANTWTAISATGAPSARTGHSVVWDGTRMIVWGGEAAGPVYQSIGGLYSPEEDKWTGVTITGAPTPRSLHTAVWTGSSMLVWGGFSDTAGLLKDTLTYTPARNFYFYLRP